MRSTGPDGIRSPDKSVLTKSLENLSDEMGAYDGFGDDQLGKGGTQLHIDIGKFWMFALHQTKFTCPRDFPFSGFFQIETTGSDKPGMVEEIVEVGEIRGSLKNIPRMVVVRHGPQGKTLMNANVGDP